MEQAIQGKGAREATFVFTGLPVPLIETGVEPAAVRTGRGVRAKLRSQTSNEVDENVRKAGKHDNIYSPGDCGISIVIVMLIHYFRYLEE